jgi:hypothetical protein
MWSNNLCWKQQNKKEEVSKNQKEEKSKQENMRKFSSFYLFKRFRKILPQ